MPKADKKKRYRGGDPMMSSSSKNAPMMMPHDPLGQQIAKDDEARRYAKASTKKSTSSSGMRSSKLSNDDIDIDDDDDYLGTSSYTVLLDRKSSQRILDMSREQRLEEEQRMALQGSSTMARGVKQQQLQQQQSGLRRTGAAAGSRNDDDDSDSDLDDVGKDYNNDEGEDEDAWVRHDDKGYVSVVLDEDSGGHDADPATANVNGAAAMSQEDLDLVHSMMNPAAERRTLADLILEKIDERQKELQHNDRDIDDPSSQLPPKVVRVYTEIGKMLSRYTAGKLPKAFKVIPSLSNWQDVLWLTRPDLWTPQAMYAATRIFASNLNPKMAQQFYQLVLLDAVRNDIHYNKKLNYHYYMSLKKSIYKPAAFFKGILLPLVEPDADTTLREAIIVASVLQRVSIPVHHAAVAIHKLSQTSTTATSTSSGTVTYNGPVSIFLKVLLNKKYSLPAPVIDGVVAYFASFLADTVRVPGGHDNVLPVLWHQALLVFVQRYKDEVRTSSTAMSQLKLVMRKHFHPKLTPEIRRELLGGQQAWKEQQVQQQVVEEGSAATMVVDD